MTKIVEFPIEKVKENNLIPIEFEYFIGEKNTSNITGLEPKEWDNISLISKGNHNDSTNLDLICAWDNLNQKCFFWGRWNDGIV